MHFTFKHYGKIFLIIFKVGCIYFAVDENGSLIFVFKNELTFCCQVYTKVYFTNVIKVSTCVRCIKDNLS